MKHIINFFKRITDWAARQLLKMWSIYLLIISRKFAVLVQPEPYIGADKRMYLVKPTTVNNFKGHYLFLVPGTIDGMTKYIDRLTKIRNSMLHVSQHHKGLSISKNKKGAKK